MAAPVPFDTVVFTEEGDVKRELTLSQFLALPLPDRIRSIVARRIEFYRDGRQLDRGEALRGLSAWQARTSTVS